MNNIPEISVIIPVYNIENYLFECLQSILSQDISNIEVICVNDGSNDNSLAVMKNIKCQDKRIKIINTEHKGSGLARNLAITYASGKYILFVDGDDFLEKRALYKMLSKAEAENVDIVMFGAFSYYEKKKKKYAGTYDYKKIPYKYLNGVFSGKDSGNDIAKFPSTSWTKLYNTDFIKKNNIKFQDIEIGQDQLFYFHSMITAKRISVLEKNLYNYRKNRKGSAMTVKKKKSFSPIYVFYGIEDLLKSKNALEKYKNILINKYFTKATSWLGKFDEARKPEYFSQYLKLLSYIKRKYPLGWWMYFSPKIDDKLIILKCKIIVAKAIFQIKHFFQTNVSKMKAKMKTEEKVT